MKATDKEFNELIKKINDIFYDDIFEDLWLKEVFKNVDIDIITSQQTDFIIGAMGGENKYCGRSPRDAHPHIFIQEDMWIVRENILKNAFKKAFAPPWIQEKWLKIDNAFKKNILKKTYDECFGRYKTEKIIIVKNPNNLKKVA